MSDKFRNRAEEQVERIYALTNELLQHGLADPSVQNELVKRELDREVAIKVINDVHQRHPEIPRLN